jgi:hypothetical protein
MPDEESMQKQRFLTEAVFGLKNLHVKSLKTDWEINRVELGLSDGERNLVIKVNLEDAQFVGEPPT